MGCRFTASASATLPLFESADRLAGFWRGGCALSIPVDVIGRSLRGGVGPATAPFLGAAGEARSGTRLIAMKAPRSVPVTTRHQQCGRAKLDAGRDCRRGPLQRLVVAGG